jgi:hypothetical protein
MSSVVYILQQHIHSQLGRLCARENHEPRTCRAHHTLDPRFTGYRVLLDTELAALYGVSTKRFNEQVRRNCDRFPSDFMFQLSAEEFESLRSQNATLKNGRGKHRKYVPYAFTEHGAVMAATILNSPAAIQMSVYVVRAFVRLRQLLSANRELAARFSELETLLRLYQALPPSQGETGKPACPPSQPQCNRSAQLSNARLTAPQAPAPAAPSSTHSPDRSRKRGSTAPAPP